MDLESMFKAGTARQDFLLLTLLLGSFLFAPQFGLQAQQPTSEPLAMKDTPLPKGFVRVPYRYQLVARGGVRPLTWRVEHGILPPGLKLDESGLLHGTPTAFGEYQFTVSTTDSDHPANELLKDLVLRIVAPLSAKWGQYPKVSGSRVEGSVKVTNGTEQDFDLTFIVLAVNEIGRATAIGYQHFTLKSNTLDMELPFGENLPHGSYQINADVVGEVAATNTIYRTRLVSNKNLEVQQGP
jgi:hypothetical protein